MRIDEAELVAFYRVVERERMHGLPIVNPRLRVEAVGFEAFDEHRFGILITPWFMNMLLLPGTDEWDSFERGATVRLDLPGGRYDFCVCRDEPGCFLSAVLFRTMSDFPDQQTACAVAEDILRRLRTTADDQQADGKRRFSRRSVMTGLNADA